MSRLFTGVMLAICALYANKAEAQSKDETEPLRGSRPQGLLLTRTQLKRTAAGTSRPRKTPTAL